MRHIEYIEYLRSEGQNPTKFWHAFEKGARVTHDTYQIIHIQMASFLAVAQISRCVFQWPCEACNYIIIYTSSSSTNTGIQTTHSLARGKDPLDPIQILADGKTKHWSKTIKNFQDEALLKQIYQAKFRKLEGFQVGGSGFSDSSLGIWIFGIRSIGFRGIKSPSMLKFKNTLTIYQVFPCVPWRGVKRTFSSVNLTSIGVIKRGAWKLKKNNSLNPNMKMDGRCFFLFSLGDFRVLR